MCKDAALVPHPRHPSPQGDRVNRFVLAKSAAAVTLAALAALGTAACTSAATSHGPVAETSPQASARPTPSGSPAPQPGAATKAQCLALEGKLMGSAAELQSAIASLSSGGNPNRALGPLQSVEKDLDAEVATVTDPALKDSAGKLATDFDALVGTVKAAADAYAAQNSSAAEAQFAKLQPEKATLEADAAAVQKLCA